jgi:hypothetical protein
MSIADFINAAKATSASTNTTPAVLEPSTEAFQIALEELDKTATSRSISDEQFRALKLLIAEYRAEIMKGSFVATREKLHNIVVWYRVSREEAFVVIKPKVVKEKTPAKPRTSRAKKALPIIEDLM